MIKPYGAEVCNFTHRWKQGGQSRAALIRFQLTVMKPCLFQLESGESTSFDTNELLKVTACCESSSNFVMRRMYRFRRTPPQLRDFRDTFLFDFTCAALCGEILHACRWNFSAVFSGEHCARERMKDVLPKG